MVIATGIPASAAFAEGSATNPNDAPPAADVDAGKAAEPAADVDAGKAAEPAAAPAEPVVEARQVSSAGTLPLTGGDIVGLTMLGLGAIGSGVAIRRVSRRRTA